MKHKKNKKGWYFKKLKKQKKAQAFEVLIKAIIVITVAVLLMFIFRRLFGQQDEVSTGQISGLTGDHDNDGIKDIIDKCPCDADKEVKCMPADDCYNEMKKAKADAAAEAAKKTEGKK